MCTHCYILTNSPFTSPDKIKQSQSSLILQVVSTVLPLQIDIPNCRQVFLQRIPDELQVGGHFVIAFGHYNFILLHINPDLGPQGYSILGIKNLTTLSPDNTHDHLSTVKLVQSDLQPFQRGSVSEVKFILGCNGGSKLVELTLHLARHQDQQDQPTLMFNSVDRVIYQQHVSIKQRVSQFFTSRLGYQQQDETSQRILDIHTIGGVYAFVTSKDIILVSPQDGSKLFNIAYMEELIDIEKEYETKKRELGMRELIQLKYLSSDIQVKEDQIVINVYNIRVQVDRGTYQAEQESTIIWQSFYIKEEAAIKLAQPSGTLFVNVPPQIQLDEIIKSFSMNFYGADMDQRSIIGVEGNNGNSLLIEISKDSELNNFKPYTNQRFIGYAIYQDLGVVPELTLITSQDIQLFRFDPTTFLDIKSTPPITKKEEIKVQEEYQYDRYEAEPKVSIIDKEKLQTFIFRLLDEYATWLLSEEFKQQDTKPFHISQKIDQLLQSITLVQFSEELKSVIIDSLDQQLQGNLFSGVRDLQEQYLFNDDGLILSTIETKEKKLDVIKNFIIQFKLNSPDRQTNLIAFIDAMQLNLNAARTLREYQEDLKTQLQKIRAQVLSNKGIPLEVRLLNNVIQKTAEQFKYDQSALKQRGTTALNVVFSFITQFDELIYSLIETSTKGQMPVDVDQREEQQDVLIAGAKILIPIVNNAISTIENQNLEYYTAYITRIDFLEAIFEMITLLTESIEEKQQKENMKGLLMEMADLYMRLLYILDMEMHDKFTVWRNNLVIYIEEKVGLSEAIDFAEKYRAQELLCRLIYEGGPSYYPVLYRCIDKWRHEFLELALKTIYDQEKLRVKNSLKKKSIEEVKTVDRINYSGFVMFDIFEEKYLHDLIAFMEMRNSKLYTILMLRHKEYQRAEDNLKIEVPRSQLKDSIKVLASLAKVNSQRFVESNYEAYYSAKFELADIQQQHMPDKAMAIKVDTAFLDSLLQSNLNKLASLVDALQYQCNVLDKAFYDTQLEQFKLLNHHAWSQLIKYDYENIKKAQNMLPGEQNVDVYTEKEIKDQVEQTLLYQIGRLQQDLNKPCKLDVEVRDSLMNQERDLQKGLNLVFRLLDTSSIHQALFATGVQSSFHRFIPSRENGEDTDSYIVT